MLHPVLVPMRVVNSRCHVLSSAQVRVPLRFSHCPDCDVDLVERPSRTESQHRRRSIAKPLALGLFDRRAEGLRHCLRESQSSWNSIRSRSGQPSVSKECGTTIQNPRPGDCYGMAEEVIRKGQVDFTDEPEDQKIMELVASGDGISRSLCPPTRIGTRRTGTWRMPLSRSGVKAISERPR